jgi:hypothetical protein
VVAVYGRVSAPLAVSRVKLQVGGSTVDSQSFPDGSSADFNLSWDATRVPDGTQATLQVVACGQGIGGALVQGSSTVAVEVGSESRSHPIWVGAVVGLSGLAGLAVSRVLTGRRHRTRDS